MQNGIDHVPDHEVHLEYDAEVWGDVRRIAQSIKDYHCPGLNDHILQLANALREVLATNVTLNDCSAFVASSVSHMKVKITMHRHHLPDHEVQDELDFYRCESTETGCDEWDVDLL